MTTEVLATPPSALTVFSRALLSTAKRNRAPHLPDKSLVLEDVATDPARLRAYSEVCGFRAGAWMPALWPHILAFPLRMTLMGDPAFPFPLPGLVHLKNHTVLRRPLRVDQRPRLHCSFGPLERHEKGLTFTAISEASVDGEVAWRDVSTLLYRTRKNDGFPAPAREDQDQPVEPPDHGETWHVPSDIGRRYGRASGDLNPIHLHPLSARLFGFERAIAHGMWSAARSLAALPSYDPGAPLTYTVWFKLPLLLPGEVKYRRKAQADGERCELRAHDDTKPHLRGLLLHRA